jgi:PiT family inorganic phosphate transporter
LRREADRVTETTVILVLVVVTALGFDFTNGFHDTANAMATSIATGALRPKVAVALSGILNLIGAFLSVEVALTVTNAVVKIQNSNGTPKTSEPITSQAIEAMIDDSLLQSATAEDVARVSARLAAGGWPLADPPTD